MTTELEMYEGFMWRPSDPSGKCVEWVGEEGGAFGAGKPYEEFLCLYPWYKSWHMEWEYTWKPYWLYYVMVERWWIPFIAIGLYAWMIIGGQKYFKDRKPWNLRIPLMLWNLGLSLFSIFGFFRVLPIVLHITKYYTWQENLCYDPHLHTGHNTGGLWIMFFSFSKFAELFDTFFIVVHKKKLILLHWYHHVSVLLYCWYFLIYTAPAGIYFCLMNYGVHSVMYGYYFLMAAKIKPSWINPKIITIAQICQMINGVVLTILGIMAQGIKGCHTKPINILPTFIMYGSYLLLFLKFYFDRYAGGKDKKNQKMKIF